MTVLKTGLKKYFFLWCFLNPPPSFFFFSFFKLKDFFFLFGLWMHFSLNLAVHMIYWKHNRTIAWLCGGPRKYILIIITPGLSVNMSDLSPSCTPLAYFYFKNNVLFFFLLPPYPTPTSTCLYLAKPHILSSQGCFKSRVYVKVILI